MTGENRTINNNNAPNAPVRYRPVQPDRPFLLASDIDGTLLGDDDGELSLNALVREYRDCLCLALITGRPFASVQELLREDRLPQPDFIVGMVGTELVDCRDEQNRLGQRFAARVPQGWDPETIYRLGEGEGVSRQVMPDGRPRFQAGFDWNGQAETLDAFCQRLSGHNGFYILPSSGRYIDVLPVQMGKGEAARFIQQELGFEPARVVVAGDTGNDRELFKTGFKGILPSNAFDELKAVRQSWHYQSAYPAGRGVLDGLCHFGLIEPVV
jgi:hydroxymethylpyrimidine pyrophosphatase-like HAD family hydrolase